ncbi:hypothetical protein SODALDRAFT_196585 [Sodiomyces alkalinus F11]|uniref:Uncharacterized protein n=1 Tax=Sodiomyces alkalinus (strain CBS 110278 / VKM F-3762 / F11) TaxID=1314773 RepID=A0A3N2PSG4_SODAK|nr:hypothetical protein SODALDRAFT_196585 [Sodiomyces alkalinus F11]ROT37428.1 hypothetical protein SODALDRAFT_196585 [Sodiomyces alkalinus F11]
MLGKCHRDAVRTSLGPYARFRPTHCIPGGPEMHTVSLYLFSPLTLLHFRLRKGSKFCARRCSSTSHPDLKPTPPPCTTRTTVTSLVIITTTITTTAATTTTAAAAGGATAANSHRHEYYRKSMMIPKRSGGAFCNVVHCGRHCTPQDGTGTCNVTHCERCCTSIKTPPGNSVSCEDICYREHCTATTTKPTELDAFFCRRDWTTIKPPPPGDSASCDGNCCPSQRHTGRIKVSD